MSNTDALRAAYSDAADDLHYFAHFTMTRGTPMQLAAERAVTLLRAALAEKEPADPVYDNSDEQDAVLSEFSRAGFRYDGQSLWSAALYTEELLALAIALVEPASKIHQAPALRGGEEPPGWISVGDRLPPDESEVLVYVPDAKHNKVDLDLWSMYREDPTGMGGPPMDMGYMWGNHGFEDVTHWMPLPAGPRFVPTDEPESQIGETDPAQSP